MKTHKYFLYFVLCSWYFVSVQAQEKDSSSVSEAVQSFLGVNQPRIGILAKMSGYVVDDGIETQINGIGNSLRIFLFHSFGGKFRFKYQGDLLADWMNGHSLLDLKLSYDYRDELSFDVGRFKTSFGNEYLVEDSKFLFVRRSYTASNIGPKRQDGIQVRGKFIDNQLAYSVGVFGGEGLNQKSRKISMYVGKLTYKSTFSEEIKFDVSSSIAYSDDENDFGDLFDSYEYYGKYRKTLSGSFRISINDLWIESEYNTLQGSDVGTPQGFYIDIGKHLLNNVETAVRFDWFEDKFTSPNIHNWSNIKRSYLFGINWYPEKELKLQFDFEHNQTQKINIVTLMLQFAVNTTN